DVALVELSNRHDIRQLVLRTALTYLELMGVLRQGTPFYAGYEFRPLEGKTVADLTEAFPGEPGKLVADLFGMAKKGRIWYSLNPEDAAAQLGQERRRIVRAVEVLQERGLAEVRVSDARQRYYRLRDAEDAAALMAHLHERFAAREAAEMK